MEEQLKELKEMLQGGLSREEEEVQMKELYDALEKEDNEKSKEHIKLKKEFSQINELLDMYGIKKCDSILERIKIALRLAA
ncbi:MAG: hypothetical protein L6V86_08450 [Treponema sp.]|nr:MAG: hypothetical protein L6V86_08450 [Treponema sp.]